MTGHQLGHIPIIGNTIPRTKIDFCTRHDVDPYSVIDSSTRRAVTLTRSMLVLLLPINCSFDENHD